MDAKDPGGPTAAGVLSSCSMLGAGWSSMRLRCFAWRETVCRPKIFSSLPVQLFSRFERWRMVRSGEVHGPMASATMSTSASMRPRHALATSCGYRRLRSPFGRSIAPLPRSFGRAAVATRSTFISSTIRMSPRHLLKPMSGGSKRSGAQVARSSASRMGRLIAPDHLERVEAHERRRAERMNAGGFSVWVRGLLIRRTISDGDLAFFTTWCPAERISRPSSRFRASLGDRGQLRDHEERLGSTTTKLLARMASPHVFGHARLRHDGSDPTSSQPGVAPQKACR